jgi:hypothetical protein
METRRWTNPSQPQTLYLAHLFLYMSAGFNVFYIVLGRGFEPFLPTLSRPSLLEIVLEVAGGYLIANERKIGYYLAFGAAALALYPPVRAVLETSVATLFSLNWILAAAFPAILLILLVHPMSREYQRIWFK